MLTSFCGDPMVYDSFKATCQTSSMCTLVATVVPGRRTDIHFTIDPTTLMLAVVYIAATPLSSDFVKEFVSLHLIELPFFQHMDAWFPAYNVVGSAERGGMAYPKPAG